MENTEFIEVTQVIEIRYNCEEARQVCIKYIEKSTDWMAFNEGGILKEPLVYGACKTKDIKVRIPQQAKHELPSHH